MSDVQKMVLSFFYVVAVMMVLGFGFRATIDKLDEQTEALILKQHEDTNAILLMLEGELNDYENQSNPFIKSKN